MSLNDFMNTLFRNWVPRNMITEELSGLYGSTVLADMGRIIKFYEIYENGTDFPTSSGDYVPSELKYKEIRTLIDKEARFLFAKPPEFFVKPKDPGEETNRISGDYQAYINAVLKENKFTNSMVKAAKDCLIGERIAIFINFDEEHGIKISFCPSLEFVYEQNDYGELDKIVAFFALNDSTNADEQRIQKKKYWMENGKCHVSEGIYSGAGALVESLIDDLTTEFEYIPAVVILNGGLTGDTYGQSEIASLVEYEEYYNRLSNLDIDAERQGMNPIRYAIDVNPKTTKDLSLAAGAFWDLQTDPNSPNEGASGRVGVLENGMSYSSPLNITLARIKETMYAQLDVPSVSSSDMRGIVTSGKTLKAIYWGLIVRCDEKMLDWRPALEFMIQCLIDGAFLYPNIASKYTTNSLSELDYVITVDNQYPLPEDEAEEKALDLSEIAGKARSIKSYLKKWQNMTEDEANAEIQQIAIEQQMLSNAFFPTPTEGEPGGEA